jgi:hypothetical protein
MNVVISHRSDHKVIVRYEIHLASEHTTPPDQAYFDEAWKRAVADRLVDADHRADYGFQLQLPTTIYEASR